MHHGGAANGGGPERDTSRQVRVRFVTHLPQPLRVQATPLAVPSHLSRMGLSEVVNLLLKSADPEHESQPFDFLIRGELVRMPLEDFLMAKDISVEETLEIEYVNAVVPRKKDDPCLHDDWVSAIDGANDSFILTGCYDGIARVWNNGATCTQQLKGHSGAITSVKTIGIDDDGFIHVVTGSKDRSLMLWKIDSSEDVKITESISNYRTLSGHTASVQCVGVNPSKNKICSGSWDCSIKLWDAKGFEEDDVTLKKRKLKSDLSAESQIEGSCSSTILAHKQSVSAVVWPEDHVLYSASWDHSLRKWDTETNQETWTVVSSKALNCLQIGGDGSALVAAGGSDPVLRIWDIRKQGTTVPVFQFSSHSSWISACKWHPRSMYHLLSASYDGKVMIWDLRTALPLAVMDSHKDKVLCADWWREESLISGGADNKLCITSALGI